MVLGQKQMKSNLKPFPAGPGGALRCLSLLFLPPEPEWPVLPAELLLGQGGPCLTHPPHPARSLSLYCFFFMGFRHGCGNCPGGPVVKTSCFHCRGSLFCPWLVKKDANAMRGLARKKNWGVILIAHVIAPLDIT